MPRCGSRELFSGKLGALRGGRRGANELLVKRGNVGDLRRCHAPGWFCCANNLVFILRLAAAAKIRVAFT